MLSMAASLIRIVAKRWVPAAKAAKLLAKKLCHLLYAATELVGEMNFRKG
jgi:hypothetical protein